MKRTICTLLALLVCGAAYATLDTTITMKEVRTPRLLKAWLDTNAADTESRLVSGATSADTLALINMNDTGTAKLTLQSDQAADAGDLYGIVASDGSGLLIQSDKDSKGTLATKLTVGNTGILTMKGSATIDNTTSASVLNLTETTITLTGAGIITGAATLGDTASVAGDLTASSDVAITSNLTVGGTAAVTGEMTLTAGLTVGTTIDADSITVDASAGIDTQSAGTLKVGESTADKIEIADTAIETEIQGTLDVHGDVDINEQITVDLDATDEEIVITQSSSAGTASTPLILINDDRTGATANEAAEATISIDAEGVYGIAINDGALYVEGDTYLKNGETIDNATDAEFRFTADDDAVLLLEIALESDNAHGNMADNDLFSITATADDSAGTSTEYASIDFKITDVTDTTEDSSIVLNYLSGAAAKAVEIGASAAGACEMDLGTVDMAIDGAGTIYCDTIEEDGTAGVAIEGMTLNDGAFTDSDGSLTMGTVTAGNYVTTGGTGTAGASTVTVVEYGDGAMKQAVITLADHVVIINGESGDGFGGTNIFTFAEGFVRIYAVVAEDITLTPDGEDLEEGEGGDFSIGSTQTSDATLDGTDVDAIAKTSIDPIQTVTDANNVTPYNLDGHTTAAALYLNVIADDGDVAALSTNTVSGTITVTYSNLGDY